MPFKCIKQNKNNTRKKACLIILGLFLCIFIPADASQNCIRTKITPLTSSITEITSSQGNTNNDPSFEEIDDFADLSTSGDNTLGVCIHKSDSARILNIDSNTGGLTLSNSFAQTDPVNSNDPGATRGICSFNPLGNQIFFLGNGPKSAGFDRIYMYRVNASQKPAALEKPDGNYFFTPNELPRNLAVTPNGKYLLYIESLTSNNNLGSIQAIEIKNNTLEQNSVGQDIAKAVDAGTNFEITGNPESDIVYGLFSNVKQGKSGSGDGFAIFQVNQENGTTTILAEYKKGNNDFPLPSLFNNPLFAGFSSLKIVEKESSLYLLVSYVENNSKEYPGFKYNTKLAVFRLYPRENSAELIPAGKPVSTVVQIAPCTEKNVSGVSGPMELSGKSIYIGDSNSEQKDNYITSFYIDWGEVITGSEESNILYLSTIPVKVSKQDNERITDISVTGNGKFIYIVLANSKSASLAKVSGYTLENLNLSCSVVSTQIGSGGICNATPEKNYVTITKNPQNIKPPDEVILNLDGSENNKPLIPSGSQNLGFLPIISPESGRPALILPTKGRPPLFGSKLPKPPASSYSPPNNIPGVKTSINSLLNNPKKSASQLQPTQSALQGAKLPVLPATADSLKPAESSAKDTVKEIAKESAEKDSEKPLTDEDLDMVLVEAEDIDENEEGDIKIDDLDVVLLASDTSEININPPNIDLNTLDLSGNYLPITAPKIPWISLNTISIEEAKIEAVKESIDKNTEKTEIKANIEPKKEISHSTETNGGINAGSGGYIITLKGGIKLHPKDLKNIIFAVTENNKDITEVDAKASLINPGKLLTSLTLPDDMKSGTTTLIAVLNKGEDKKTVISKGKIDVLESLDFENLGNRKVKINAIPAITKIEGRVTGNSQRGGKIIRLKIYGNNFASRFIQVGNTTFIPNKLKSHTLISFGNSNDIEVLRTKVTTKGDKMLVTIRSQKEDISSIPITVSTPKGQYFKNKLGVKFLTPGPEVKTPLKTQ